MKKPKMLMINEEVYHVEVIFAFGCTYKELEDWWNKTYPKENNALGGDRSWAGGIWKVTSDKGEEHLLIWVEKRDDIDSLQHEVNHLVMQIFKDRDVDFDYDHQEAFCYYSQFWFTRLRNLMRTNGKSFRSK